MPLSLVSTEFIALKGTLITLLIPLIIALTTVLKALTIPSLIPSNILPPVEKTSLTFCQALEKIFLNHSGMLVNTPLIPSHAFEAPVLMLFQIPEKKFDTGVITFP